MEPLCYEALLIPLGGGVFLRLEDESLPEDTTTESFELRPALPIGWRAIDTLRRLDASAPSDRPPIEFDSTAPERGLHALRLFELRDYAWQLIFETEGDRPETMLTSSLMGSSSRGLWKSRRTHGRFRFVNYLGSAWIEASTPGLPPSRISFEVATPKLDYEQEYRSMVESIGAECQQLLLEWGTPTSLRVTADPDKLVQTLLEQFLFLRHVLGSDKLDLYLETIARNAHSQLQGEVEWRPAGTGDPTFFLRDPLKRGNDWRHIGERVVPGTIQTERRFESTNTPPNRFVKFALQSFHSLCNSVMNATRNGKRAFAPDDAVTLEASAMLQLLDAFLVLPLFDDVDDLQRIPFESTTLQRREGYREVLLAWLMLDAAAQLDWPGREEAYDGTTRDVATLYEYWLYFALVRAFRDRLGMIPEADPLEKVGDALPFCCRPDDGRLVINLSQGKASFSRFLWRKDGHQLRVHFFYNRQFRQSGVDTRGSYSKTFRPDYTLVIIPQEFDQPKWEVAERTAEEAGRIAYLHFDAKYRGENLPGIFGNEDAEDTESPDERSLRADDRVKNIDLYKMHTYNEAIRRTVGSYVLYPGLASDVEGSTRFQRYHEHIPGIGAFAVRPPMGGDTLAGLTSVCGFISDVLSHQLDRFTQSYRITSATEGVIREKPVKFPRGDAVEETVSLPSASAILGYMRKADIEDFADRKCFYCRATDQHGDPLSSRGMSANLLPRLIQKAPEESSGVSNRPSPKCSNKN